MSNYLNIFLEFLKKYWYIIISVLCLFLFQSRSFVFINTDKKVKVELYDICLDSLDKDEVLDGYSYEPKKVKYIAWHCTGTVEGKDYTTLDISNWWRSRSWKVPGYHVIIHPNGKIDTLVNLDKDEFISYKERVNGVKGYNSVTISIAYIGGLDKFGRSKDTRTPSQKLAMLNIKDTLNKQFPKAIHKRHRDFPNIHKDCPSF